MTHKKKLNILFVIFLLLAAAAFAGSAILCNIFDYPPIWLRILAYILMAIGVISCSIVITLDIRS